MELVSCCLCYILIHVRKKMSGTLSNKSYPLFTQYVWKISCSSWLEILNRHLCVLHSSDQCQRIRYLIVTVKIAKYNILFGHSEDIVWSYYARRLFLETSDTTTMSFSFDDIYELGFNCLDSRKCKFWKVIIAY